MLNKITKATINGRSQKFLDRSFCEETGLPSLVLMEQAAQGLTDFLRKLLPLADIEPGRPIIFLAGNGGNGGDAWASARQMMGYGYRVKLLELFPKKKLADDARCNREAYLKLAGETLSIDELDRLLTCSGEDRPLALVDGIMGTGFTLERPLPESLQILLTKINRQKDILKVAIDIPTGLESATGAVANPSFEADYTVTFSTYKTALYADPATAYCGQLILTPISMSSTWIDQKLAAFSSATGEKPARLIDLDTARVLHVSRGPLSHKGNFGKCLIIGGSPGMAGAFQLALRAARATGVGYCYGRTGPEGLPIALEAMPEALLDSLPETSADLLDLLGQVDSVAVGPGIGRSDWLTNFLPDLISHSPKLILDADALNSLSLDPAWPDLFKVREAKGLVPALLTPHPGEFSRLAPDLKDLAARDRQAAARSLAQRSHCQILLKGHRSVLALPDGQVYLNSSGNQGLAKAGSGDVLTGLLAGFSAQYKDLDQAAALAMFTHGYLAELAAQAEGFRLMQPGQLLDYCHQAYRDFDWLD